MIITALMGLIIAYIYRYYHHYDPSTSINMQRTHIPAASFDPPISTISALGYQYFEPVNITLWNPEEGQSMTMFIARIALARRPLLIRNAPAVREWTAFKKWNGQYLAGKTALLTKVYSQRDNCIFWYFSRKRLMAKVIQFQRETMSAFF